MTYELQLYVTPLSKVVARSGDYVMPISLKTLTPRVDNAPINVKPAGGGRGGGAGRGVGI